MEWTWLFFFKNKCIVYHRCMTLILTHIWWNNIHRYRLNHFCTHTFTIADDLDYKKETRDKNAFQILTLLNYYYCVWINSHQISLRMDSSKYIIYCRLFLILFRSFLNINSRLPEKRLVKSASHFLKIRMCIWFLLKNKWLSTISF
jgi:hypothetical protein